MLIPALFAMTFTFAPLNPFSANSTVDIFIILSRFLSEILSKVSLWYFPEFSSGVRFFLTALIIAPLSLIGHAPFERAVPEVRGENTIIYIGNLFKRSNGGAQSEEHLPLRIGDQEG